MILYRMLVMLSLWIPMTTLAHSQFLTGSSLQAHSVPVAPYSRFYRFERMSFVSIDQQRHYQVTVATPKAAPPQQGYPVLYMLDGRAALAALTESRLSRLQGADWPVIVTLGYQTDTRVARAYDYTPVPATNNIVPHGQKFGGAEQFLQFIEQVVKPKIGQRVTIDNTRQSLWGHSFGGLFVLHTLFNHPASFQTYIAADPSLWWQQGQMLQDAITYEAQLARPQGRLLIQQSASRRTGSKLAENATRELAKRLSQLPELEVQYHDYFQHHHGSVRAASIPAALRIAQGEGKR